MRKEIATIFLDRNVISRSIDVESATKDHVVAFGDITQHVEIMGFKRKSLRKGDGGWITQEVECLPTIAQLAEDKKVELITSDEVWIEGMSASMGLQGVKGDFFRNCEIRQVHTAIGRSYFQQMSLDEFVKPSSVSKFCEFLRSLCGLDLAPIHRVIDKMPASMQQNFEYLGRFHELTDACHKKHWPDALHLWTAECHSADFFLTFDIRFINALTKSANINTAVPMVTPKCLLKELGIKNRVPMPIEGFEFQFLNNA